MRGKLMMMTVFLLFAFMLAPVAAKPIGPVKSEKNPNIVMHDGETVLLTLGGVQHEWYDTEAGWMDFINILNASKVDWPWVPSLSVAQVLTLMTDPVAASEFENKWIHMSQAVLFDLLKLFYPEDVAWAIASMWPAGMYLMYVNVGD